MKSKIIKTIGLIAALVACVGMTVFAAPSPSASTVVTNATTTQSGVRVILEDLPDEYKQVASDIKTEAGLKAALGSDFDENLTVAEVVNVRAESINGGQVSFPIDITFEVKGVTTNTKGYILHWKDGAWEKIPTTIGEGTMTGTFTSLSPVAFVVDKTTLSSGTATSPKTSAVTVTGVAMIGMAAATGVLGLKKKEY